MRLQYTVAISDTDMAQFRKSDEFVGYVHRRLTQGWADVVLKEFREAVIRTGRLSSHATEFNLNLHVHTQEQLEEYVQDRVAEAFRQDSRFRVGLTEAAVRSASPRWLPVQSPHVLVDGGKDSGDTIFGPINSKPVSFGSNGE